MKKFLLSIFIVFALSTPAISSNNNFDFYFFGINTKMLKEADYKMIILGAATSIAVHTAGHYLYAAANRMQINQHGFDEIVIDGYSSKKYREFAQAGFLLQNAVGLTLTSIPATRNTDFTRGYVVAAFVEISTYPLSYTGNRGDLYWSNYHGGNRDIEYFMFLSAATHNLMRVNFKK